MNHIESLFSPENRHYGLEIQQPYAELLLTGVKTIETRSYPLPSNLLYRHILIIESSTGKDGVSELPSVVRNSGGDVDGTGPRIVGSVVFSECFEYSSEKEWRDDENKHLVPAGSLYDWPRSRSPGPKVSSTTAIINTRRAQDEDAHLEELRLARKQSKQTRQHDGDIAANNIVTAISIAAGAESPLQQAATSSPERKDMSRRWGGALVEHVSPERRHLVKSGARYGWRVLGVFRAPCTAELIPQMMRVHRSLFDCGSAAAVLPSS